MCHRMGRPPISIIGFGLRWVSSAIRVPYPPARMTAFIDWWDYSENPSLNLPARFYHGAEPGPETFQTV